MKWDKTYKVKDKFLIPSNLMTSQITIRLPSKKNLFPWRGNKRKQPSKVT